MVARNAFLSATWRAQYTCGALPFMGVCTVVSG